MGVMDPVGPYGGPRGPDTTEEEEEEEEEDWSSLQHFLFLRLPPFFHLSLHISTALRNHVGTRLPYGSGPGWWSRSVVCVPENGRS